MHHDTHSDLNTACLVFYCFYGDSIILIGYQIHPPIYDLTLPPPYPHTLPPIEPCYNSLQLDFPKLRHAVYPSQTLTLLSPRHTFHHTHT